MTRPSLKQLEYILAVARYGSFRRAADKLAISQPTLTAQIARAEKALNVTLFERTRSGAALTPAGRKLEGNIRHIIDALENLVENADNARAGGRGVYRLGVAATLGPFVLPQILPGLHAIYADLKLYIREDSPRQLEYGLERGDYDLILTALPINSSQLVSENLMRESVKLVVPRDHPLAVKAQILAADLAGTQILTTEEGLLFSRQVEQVCARLGAEVLRDYQGTSLDALRVMVVMGMGLAFLPALYIESEINADTALSVRQIEDESIARIHALAWRPTSPARVFYRHLAEDMRDLLRASVGSVVDVLDN
ncbi:hydrogen peroxide-inducible genes activator [Chromatocurvus halotolerans]|uniref:LysR family transcriptional regulator n=1 Tax=Chromatocurvus halotolerans TaxID=1132028 RepID=A0A4R2L207_9GAMM|nr:hydrogen peroxide-inducible genes activator [Chromatocurvus halotolerans]TCO77776.1 LysR family transcriptional regulator [Chromatocurvus halotolerans]